MNLLVVPILLFMGFIVLCMMGDGMELAEPYHCDEYPHCIKKCPYGECNRKIATTQETEK